MLDEPQLTTRTFTPESLRYGPYQQGQSMKKAEPSARGLGSALL